MLIILRMNRDFMRFMREHHADILTDPHQKFGRTIVEEEVSEEEFVSDEEV